MMFVAWLLAFVCCMCTALSLQISKEQSGNSDLLTQLYAAGMKSEGTTLTISPSSTPNSIPSQVPSPTPSKILSQSPQASPTASPSVGIPTVAPTLSPTSISGFVIFEQITFVTILVVAIIGMVVLCVRSVIQYRDPASAGYENIPLNI